LMKRIRGAVTQCLDLLESEIHVEFHCPPN
jgi:hypothetical protein